MVSVSLLGWSKMVVGALKWAPLDNDSLSMQWLWPLSVCVGGSTVIMIPWEK